MVRVTSDHGSRRRTFVTVVGGILAVSTALPLLNVAPGRWLPPPKILVVVEAEERTSYGDPVIAGVTQAQTEESTPLDVIVVQIDALSEMPMRPIVEAIAKDNILAVIAATTSRTTQTLVALTEPLGIPTLLTVATKDTLLDNTKNTLRLLPPDQKQAELLAKWCGSGTSRVAILFDTSSYAQSLAGQVIDRIKHYDFVTFSLGTTTDIAGVLNYGNQAKATKWIVIGYKTYAQDFLQKKISFPIPGETLLSDGANGDWLQLLVNSTGQTDIQVVYPYKKPTRSSPRAGSQKQTGYSVFGYDAYTLISKAYVALTGAKATTLSRRTDLVNDIRYYGEARSRNSEFTILDYHFLRNGENSEADFAIVKVGRQP